MLVAGVVQAEAVHLMALCELAVGDETGTQDARTQYGFAFLDAAAGHYYVGCASDDAGRANIGAILAQVRPG